MKNHPLSCLLLSGALFLVSHASAQTDFSLVDERARKVTFPKKQNITQLAADLTTGLATETEKSRAIFVWVTKNIRYDIQLLNDDDMESAERKAKQQPGVVLSSRKAICEGYANLFQTICTAAGLQSVVATGVTKKPSGRIARIGHAWNLVRADGRWYPIDATWGAGYLDDNEKYVVSFDEKFFFSAPQEFAQDHFPTDPLFQLLEKPIDFSSFKLKPAERKTLPAATTIFTLPNPTDSLNLLVGLDSAAARLNSTLRTLRFDPQSGQANFYLALHQFEAAGQLIAAHQAVQTGLIQKKVPVTRASLQGSDERMLAIQQKLKECQQTIAIIQPGDRYWRNGQSLRRTAEANLNSCKEVLEGNAMTRKKLKG